MKLSHQRLLNQHLTAPLLTEPAGIVKFFGATQAQDYLFAKWSLAQRLVDATDATLEAAFSSGAILRTHVMRPTWFFVHPDDIRWMLALTAERVHRLNALYYRKESVDAIKTSSMQVIERALTEHESLTRDELYGHLRGAGLVGDKPGLRGLYILMHAELEALICSGPMRGKQQTYTLLDRRAPNTIALPRDESLHELARRFFVSHGPATRKDFARWSGLTLADSDVAIRALAAELESETIDEEQYWFASSSPEMPTSTALPTSTDAPPRAFLVSGYDEYLNGYASWNHATERTTAHGIAPDSFLLRNQMAIVDGQIVGVWSREVRSRSIQVEVIPFFPLSSGERHALLQNAQALGDHYARPADLTIAPIAAQ